MGNKKIHIIAGARPNFMKIAPIIRELDKNPGEFSYQLIHTGQHYDDSMSDIFFKELSIPKPDFHLNVGSGSHADQTARIMMEYEPICVSEKPDIVLVVGDVNSTVACSLVAKKLQIKIVHIEAGLRSGDMEMPEEINRIVTDSITDYFFVTEESGVKNLLSEGKLEKDIYFVGHVMIDNLLHQMSKLKSSHTPMSDEYKKNYPEYGVVTLHRPSNVDNTETFERVVSALNKVSQNLPLIFSMHPRTKNNIENHQIDISGDIVIVDSLPYMEFLNLMKDARMVLTDSGGLQEETTALGIPCITIRENTERPITITEGTNKLVGTDAEKIIFAAKYILENELEKKKIPKYWDGKASVRIIECLQN